MENYKIEDAIVFDASPSKRRYDENGFLHIDDCPITKEQVVAYFGIEIPGWHELGLDPKKEYFGYRPAKEIQKAADTFSGLPLLLLHEPESAARPTDRRVGGVGTSPRWDAPYLRQPLSITVDMGIKAVETGKAKQLSSSYRYDPDFTPGVFEGKKFDFVMRNLRGNHVAFVPKGRAGDDVIVADSQPEIINMDEEIKKDGDPKVKAQEISVAKTIGEEAKTIESLHTQNPDGSVQNVNEDGVDGVNGILAKIASMEADDLAKVKAALGMASDNEEEVDVIADAMKACGLDAANIDMRKAFEAGRSSMNSKPEQAMDSAALFHEMSERNRYGQALLPHIGNFAFDHMPLNGKNGVLYYGCKKLNLNARPGHEKAAIDGFLAASTPKKTVRLTNDAAPNSKGADMINQVYGGK